MKNKLAVIFLIIIAAGLYGLTLRGVSGNPEPATIKDTLQGSTKPFELSPERGRFAHVMALAANHTYSLSEQLADFVYPDVGYSNGKFYSFFAPGISYMALPFYEWGAKYQLSQVATFGFISLMAIIGLLALFMVGRHVLRLPLWAAVTGVIIFAFGTTSWSYAITLYQHHLTTLFILGGFYAVWKYKQQQEFSWIWAALVWSLYALAIFIDYPNAILMLPVMVYLAIVAIKIFKVGDKVKVGIRTSAIVTFIFFLLISGLHAYHNQKYFGSWKTISGGLVGYKFIKDDNLVGKSPAEINDALKTQNYKKNVVGFFNEEQIPNSPGTLLFSKDRGLFFYMPIFILALLGLYKIRRRLNLEYGVLLGIVLVNLFLYSSWGDPWGGWAYGPRYLIPSMAVLSLFIGVWLVNGRFAVAKKIVALILFAYSAGVAVLGAVTTNAVPPRIEADYLHLQYNFFYNYKYLIDGQSGSYLFNTYFSKHMSLPEYAFALYGIVLLIFILVLFVLPLLDRREKPENREGDTNV